MRHFNKYKKSLFIFLCLAFVFSVCLEPVEAGEHEGEDPMSEECCFICHPTHGGVLFEPVDTPSISALVVSKAYSFEQLSLADSPVFPLFHPPQNLV